MNARPHVEGPDFDRMAEDRKICAEAREDRETIKQLQAQNTAMREALEAVLQFLTRNYPTSGHIDTICAALSAARGNTRKE